MTELKKSWYSRAGSIAKLGTKITADGTMELVRGLFVGREQALANLHLGTAKRLLETLGSMKGLPMKMGQILSFMDGVIPVEYQEIYRNTLAPLQNFSHVKSWDQMQPVFLNAFGVKPDDVFASFSKTPIAAASIGQVYRATLKDGREVAVKIQYPDMQDVLQSDLKTVETIVKTLRTVFPAIDNRQFSEDVLSRFSEELDYGREAKNQQEFFDRWKGDPWVVIPSPVLDLCRSRVLVSEFHEGSKLTDVVSGRGKLTRSHFGNILFKFTCRSIFSFGLFNADPHPGNFLFQQSGQVVFLDFGCVQHYGEETKDAFKVLMTGILNGARGNDLWKILEETLLISPGTSNFARDSFLNYLEFILEPILSPQPYRFTMEYTTKVSQLGAQLKMNLARNFLELNWKEPKREGFAPLLRILFGLNSLLAELQAEGDWRSIVKEDLELIRPK